MNDQDISRDVNVRITQMETIIDNLNQIIIDLMA